MSENVREMPSSDPATSECAQAGSVDEHAAVGQRDQLARDRGVTTALVADSDRAGLLAPASEQGVHDGRLAGAGGAQQDGGARPGR